MTLSLNSFVLPHVGAGTLALLLFWVTVLTRKGSRSHRRIGQAYLLAMLVVIVTAIPMTIHLYLIGKPVIASFMAYLVILVSWSCATAFRAIRYRTNVDAYYSRGQLLSTLALAFSGLLIMVLGGIHGAFVLIAFGAIGPFTATLVIRDRMRTDRPRNWWLKEHFNAMIGNGVATHIAFAQIGLSRLVGPDHATLVVNLGWMMPLVIGSIAGIWLNKRYQSAPVKMRSTLETAPE